VTYRGCVFASRLCLAPRAGLVAASLAGTVYSAQEAAQVPRQCDKTDAQKFKREAVAWQDFRPPSRAEMYPPRVKTIGPTRKGHYCARPEMAITRRGYAKTG
jgi:hypothetical protein